MGISRVSVLIVYTWSNRVVFLQLRLRCPTSPQFQQIGPGFPVDVEAKDDSEELCLTPHLFKLLDVVSCVEGELVLSA